jgi:hypothetical protein
MQDVTQSLSDAVIAEMRKRGLLQVISHLIVDDPTLNPKKSFFNIEILKEKIVDALSTVDENKNIPDIIICVNERYLNEIFNIDEDMYNIAIKKMIATIGYNFDNGKIMKNTPDVSEFSLILEQEGYEKSVIMYNAARSQAYERYIEALADADLDDE